MADRLVLCANGGEGEVFDVEQVKTLNDLERMGDEYAVKEPERVKYMRIRELASEVHVSTSTILRFCNYHARLGQAKVTDDISEVIDFLKKTSSQEFERRKKKSFCWYQGVIRSNGEYL